MKVIKADGFTHNKKNQLIVHKPKTKNQNSLYEMKWIYTHRRLRKRPFGIGTIDEYWEELKHYCLNLKDEVASKEKWIYRLFKVTVLYCQTKMIKFYEPFDIHCRHDEDVTKWNKG